MNWDNIRESAKIWSARIAQFVLFEHFVFYVFACIAANDAVGIKGYISFLYHCTLWQRH